MTDTFSEAEEILAEPAPDDELLTKDGKRYRLPDPKTGTTRTWQRVTTFNKAASDTFLIREWDKRIVAEGVAMSRKLQAQIAAVLSEDLSPAKKKAELQPLADEAQRIAGAKDPAEIGTALHRMRAALDKGRKFAPLEPWDQDLKVYQELLAREGLTPVPEYVERTIVHRGYQVAGTFDGIVRCPDGKLRMMDLKTGRTLEYGWGEIEVQCFVYSDSRVIYNKDSKTYEPMPEIEKDYALVIHLPAGAGQAFSYEVDLQQGKYGADLAKTIWAYRKGRQLPKPRTSVELPPDVSSDHAAFLVRISKATHRQELKDIWQEAEGAGVWNDVLMATARRKYQELSN
jgi:hypothetical protein